MRLWRPGRDERGDAALCAAIRGRITAAGGVVPFATFMAQALQHPESGYYRAARRRVGRDGDFLTSPAIHPSFAATMARQLAACADVLGSGAGRTWIEAGAGEGTMAASVAAILGRGEMVVALDAGPRHGEGFGDAAVTPLRVRSDRLPFATESVVGGIYANELLDAFPVHVLRRDGTRWREDGVGVADDGSFVWRSCEPDPATAAAADRALRRGATLADGGTIELCGDLDAWIADAARVLRRGFLLLVDYGDDTPRLWNGVRASTLRAFAGHAAHGDPLTHVGEQDLTTHVDFGAVVDAARRAGLEAVAFLDQRRWLDGWGVGEARDGWEARVARGAMRADEAEVNVRAVDLLRDPRGLGAIRVLALAKGLSPVPIPGLTGPAPAAMRFTASDLPRIELPDPFAPLY